MTGRRFARFCAVGGANTFVHMAVAWLLVSAAGLPLLPSNAVAFLVANMVSFLMNATFTFGMSLQWRRYPAFLGVSMTALVASTLLVALTDHAGVHYLVGIAAAAVLSAVVGFVLSNRWVFRAPARTLEEELARRDAPHQQGRHK
jgi:putative flippase GtrA